jgi:hypothetical protein
MTTLINDEKTDCFGDEVTHPQQLPCTDTLDGKVYFGKPVHNTDAAVSAENFNCLH